jgi:hypothetical protein
MRRGAGQGLSRQDFYHAGIAEFRDAQSPPGQWMIRAKMNDPGQAVRIQNKGRRDAGFARACRLRVCQD